MLFGIAISEKLIASELTAYGVIEVNNDRRWLSVVNGVTTPYGAAGLETVNPCPWPLTWAAQARKSPVVNAMMMRCTVGESRGIALRNGVSAGGCAVCCAIAECVKRYEERRPDPPSRHFPAEWSECYPLRGAVSHRSIAERRIVSSTIGLVM
jgi:hypothetical protein